MFICVNTRPPFRCHQDRVRLEVVEIEPREEELRLLICPRCKWPALALQGLIVFDDKGMPADIRHRFHQTCAQLGLPTQDVLRRGRPRSLAR